MITNYFPTTPPTVIHRPVINHQLLKQAATTLPAPEKVQQTAAQQGLKECPHQAKTLHKPTWQFDSRFRPQLNQAQKPEQEPLVSKNTGSLDLLHQQAQQAYTQITKPEHRLIVDRII